MTVTVLVVEEDATFAERFRACVENEPKLRLGGSAATVAAGIAMFDAVLPDVLLLALGLPDGSGIDLIRHAKARHPSCEVLVVTRFADNRSVTQSIRAGATGYLLKDASLGDVAQAILQLIGGGAPLSAHVARWVVESLRRPADAAPASSAPASSRPPLSARELEILHLVAKGLNFREVALVLDISPFTVTTHVKRIYEKLSVHSRGEAVYEAGQMGLLLPPSV